MAVYFVTGKLGSGKSLVAVGKIQDRITRGLKVATNLDLKLFNMPRVGKFAKSPRVLRIPDKPTIQDLDSIGIGNYSYDESLNGLLVLDECGTWFNTRTWNDKSRQPVIDWFIHSRKKGWDIIFLVQDISLIDKQARESLAEHVVYCRRMDKLSIPFIGFLFSFIVGSKLPLPKIHLGIVKYGDSNIAPVVDRWVYRGNDLYSSYDTKQEFSSFYNYGVYSVIPPYLSHGRYFKNLTWLQKMKLTKIYFRKYSRITIFIFGALSGIFFNKYNSSPVLDTKDEQVMDFSGYKIVSSSHYGDSFYFTIKDSQNNFYSSSELNNKGYKIIYLNSCRFKIIKGGYHAFISC
ncbi:MULTISPECIES: zonular occludens toxin domain-containing protein [unclassified Providencia]|uniref:zonular occludens toxin domain-containing protein n=1 Tax=unclassified Providencia TaxID=2633465 RepID=UPI00234BCE61|nr:MULTISPECIES: zonular occludens toxin domain-containing protein [unclassified Providencia]